MRKVVLAMSAALFTMVAITGCGSKGSSSESTSKPSSKDDDDKASDKKKKKHSEDDNGMKATGSSSAAPEAPLASGSAPPVAAPVSQPTNLPTGRSAVPSVTEWASAKEITVKGSSALGCETKIIREWFRVSCHGANDTGGTPTAVKVTKGGDAAETFVFVTGDIASLVFPYVDGTSLEAVFSWTDKSHKLVASWPHGSPEPEIKGVFEGAASPLDRASREPGDGVCECDYKQNGTTFCEPYMWGPNAGACETKYAGSCWKMLKCAVGDTSFPP